MTATADRATSASSGPEPQLPPTITYERRGHIAVITINRPEALNALSIEMMAGIDAAFAAFNADPDLWAAVFTGAGEKSFCSGGDLDETIHLLTSNQRGQLIPDDTKRFFSDVFKPIVAAVNGYCIAGGLEMLQGTDIRIAAPHATFGLGEVRWGLVPGGGSHIRLPRQIPWAVAMEILLLGRTITAERAREVGLVNEVVPMERLQERAIEIAELLCTNGPVAVRTAKEISVRAMNLEPGFVLERALSEKAFATEDAKEGPRAFLEKRRPEFKGR